MAGNIRQSLYRQNTRGPRSSGGYLYGSAGPQWDSYWRAKDAAEQHREAAPVRRASSMMSLMGMQPSGGGGGGGGFMGGGGGGAISSSFGGSQAAAMPMSGGGGNIQSTASVAPIDTRAADDARFARARDQAGMTGRASLESLRGLLGETGQLGGGAEAAATRDIVQHAAGQMGEVSRSQAIQGSERNFQTAFANQQAGLTQRGQDAQTAMANQQAGVTQRGQDISAQEAQARLAFAQTQLQSQRSLEMLRMALSQAAMIGSLY